MYLRWLPMLLGVVAQSAWSQAGIESAAPPVACQGIEIVPGSASIDAMILLVMVS